MVMREWLRGAPGHIAECDRYRLLPVYALLLVAMVRVLWLAPFELDYVYYKIYLGFWVWESEVLAEHGAIFLAICLALIGLFRRPVTAKILSATALILALNTLWDLQGWANPVAVFWREFTYWSFDMPIGFLEARARPNTIPHTGAYAVYAVMIWLLVRPLYRRLGPRLQRLANSLPERHPWLRALDRPLL